MFLGLLKRYCEHDVDQFSLLKVSTENWGTFFIEIGLMARGDPGVYASVDEMLAKEP